MMPRVFQRVLGWAVFKSLQWRLLLSYVFIIIICLILVGLAFIVLLRGYQRAMTYTRLTDRAVLSTGLVAQMMGRGIPPQEAIQRLAAQLNREPGKEIEVALLDGQGRVIAASSERLQEHRLEVKPPPGRPVRGERQTEEGERLLYVAAGVRPPYEGAIVPPWTLVLAEPLRPTRQALDSLLPRLLWAGLIALAVSVVVAAMMAYSIARPLDRIAQAAEEVASGNYDQELRIDAPTEIARLARSFNSMARQVQATLRSQQDLVANVSHELKTPLTSIQGFSQALLDGTASDPEVRQRAAEIIHEEAGRMRRLVDELLDLARLEAGQVELAQEEIDIGALLRAGAERFGPQAEQAQVELRVEADPALPPVRGDADRLEQVFANLLDNAIRHVGAGGQVTLSAEQQGASLVCAVTDNGPGIPAEDLPRLFERFYQVDKSRVRERNRRGGAGLGLAIAREIVLAHGGQIRVESVEGLGTRFTVELPIQAG